MGDNYRWKYVRKVAFLFCDTFKCQRFVHSGMDVCDINHVKTIFGLMAESPLMEYDDAKGIVEGFAGLVLLSDEIYYGDDDDVKRDVDALSTASTWTSDEDDEQIQSLKRSLTNGHAVTATGSGNNASSGGNCNQDEPKTASVSYSNLPPPQLANTFAEFTQRQKAKLTQNNLEKHTKIEQTRHRQQVIHATAVSPGCAAPTPTNGSRLN